MRRSTLIIATCAVMSRIAAADSVVVAIDASSTDIYIDAGAEDGVGVGAELELQHEVVAKDPRSGTTLHDHFALGTITVVKAGDRVALARAPAELAKRILVGDRVQLVSAKRAFIDPWQQRVALAKPSPSSPSSGRIDHAELARAAWLDTLGTAPERRVERWTQLLAADPETPYRTSIELEIASLTSQIAARDHALEQARSALTGDRDPRIVALARSLGVPLEDRDAPVALGPVDHAVPGRSLDLAFVIRAPGLVRRAWLFVRASGDPGFKRIELVRDGDAYLRAEVPGTLVHGSQLDWYVEVGDREGASHPTLGSHDAPRAIRIARAISDDPIARGRSHVDVVLDYVDFDNQQGTRFDRYYQAEIDFKYRFLDPIYSVSLGFGTLSGTGGPKEVIDADPAQCRDGGDYQCKRLTFSYVYSEFEYRFTRHVAVMLRPQVGVLTTDTRPDSEMSRCQGSDVAQCDFLVGAGLRGRVRFGDETGTNLLIGAGFTKGVGTLLEASYQWLPAPILPVQLGVQVTDQPVLEDYGVRLIGDVGLKKLSWFYPSARVSYQARSRDHAGYSGGVAMNFDW